MICIIILDILSTVYPWWMRTSWSLFGATVKPGTLFVVSKLKQQEHLKPIALSIQIPNNRLFTPSDYGCADKFESWSDKDSSLDRRIGLRKKFISSAKCFKGVAFIITIFLSHHPYPYTPLSIQSNQTLHPITWCEESNHQTHTHLPSVQPFESISSQACHQPSKIPSWE